MPPSFDAALVAAQQRQDDSVSHASMARTQASAVALDLQCRLPHAPATPRDARRDLARVWTEAMSLGEQVAGHLGSHEMMVLDEASSAFALSLNELKRLRRELACRIHPDRLGESYREAGERQMKAVNRMIDDLLRRDR